MGIALPFVGYVAATRHGGKSKEKANQNKIAEVKAFVDSVVDAFQCGWSSRIYPSGSPKIHENGTIPAKNYLRQIYFESNLVERPELVKLVQFLKAAPEGGTVCLVDANDLFSNTASNESNVGYSINQCSAVQALFDVPIVVCGRRRKKTSLVSRVENCNRDSKVFDRIILRALTEWASHQKRLETLENHCILRDLNLSQPNNMKLMKLHVTSGAACNKCVTNFDSHMNVHNVTS